MQVTKHKRFEVIHKQGTIAQQIIIVDTETGVNYLQVCNGSAGGVTPLLDRNGNVIVSSVHKNY